MIIGDLKPKGSDKTLKEWKETCIKEQCSTCPCTPYTDKRTLEICEIIPYIKEDLLLMEVEV